MNTVPQRIDSDVESVERDLAKLVLSIVELIRKLMERQVMRRVDAGSLTAVQIENVGLGLMRLEAAIVQLREQFGLRADDLNIDLGPLGSLLPDN
jgi:hypothetical protein